MTLSDHPELRRVWLKPAEVAEMTGFSLSQVYTALQTGELKSGQRGKWKRYRIHIDWAHAWAAGEPADSAANA